MKKGLILMPTSLHYLTFVHDKKSILEKYTILFKAIMGYEV